MKLCENLFRKTIQYIKNNQSKESFGLSLSNLKSQNKIYSFCMH